MQHTHHLAAVEVKIFVRKRIYLRCKKSNRIYGRQKSFRRMPMHKCLLPDSRFVFNRYSERTGQCVRFACACLCGVAVFISVCLAIGECIIVLRGLLLPVSVPLSSTMLAYVQAGRHSHTHTHTHSDRGTHAHTIPRPDARRINFHRIEEACWYVC